MITDTVHYVPSAVFTGLAPGPAIGTRGTPAKTPPSRAPGRAQQRAERPRPWTESASPATNGVSPGSRGRAAHLSNAAAPRAGPPVSVGPGKTVADASPRDSRETQQQRPQRSGADSRRSSAATPRGQAEAAGLQKPSLSPSGGVSGLRLRSTSRRSAPPAYRLDAMAGRSHSGCVVVQWPDALSEARRPLLD